MNCIDCGEQRPVMLHQRFQLGRWLRTWVVCVPCWRAFPRSETR